MPLMYKKDSSEWTIPDFQSQVNQFQMDRMQGNHSTSSFDFLSEKATLRLVFRDYLTYCKFEVFVEPKSPVLHIPAKIDLVVSDEVTGGEAQRMTDPDFLPLANRERIGFLQFYYVNDSIPPTVKVKLEIEFLFGYEFSDEQQQEAPEDPADVELVGSDGNSIFTYKFLLPDVFKAMVDNSESKPGGKLVMKDMSTRVLKVFLSCLVNDKVDWEKNSDLAEELLALGDKYNCEILKQVASRYIGENYIVANSVKLA